MSRDPTPSQRHGSPQTTCDRIENLLAREKKKRSKETKQSRLHSLAELGIPMSSSHLVQSNQQRQQVYSPGYASRPSSVGVIRDSRLIRQERHRPYVPSFHAQQSPQLPEHFHPPSHSPSHHRMPSSHMLPDPAHQGMCDPTGPTQGGRRRGTTLGGYEGYPDHAPVLSLDSDYTQHNLPVNSLSQPTTPEATYSMHANMLSHELSRHQSQSPEDTFRHSNQAPAPLPSSSGIFAGEPDSTFFRPNATPPEAGYASSPGYAIEGQSFAAVPTSTGLAHALPSVAPSPPVHTSVSSTPISVVIPKITSPSLLQPRMTRPFSELEQQLAIRRRSSFDIGDFWRRTSVADAAVANFFDRVIQAREAKKGSFDTALLSASRSFPSMTSEPLVDQPPAPSETPYSMYGNLQEVMQNAAPVDLPFTAFNSSPNQAMFSPFSLDGGQQPAQLSQANGRLHGSDHDQHSSYSSPSLTSTISSSQYDMQNVGGVRNASVPVGSFFPPISSPMMPPGAATLTEKVDPLLEGSFFRQAPPQHLNLSDLPDFHLNRDLTSAAALHSADGVGQSALERYFSPHSMSAPSSSNGAPSAPTSSYDAGGPSSQNIYFASPQPLPPTADLPSLATPMSELSSNMFAMVPPSMSPSRSNVNPRSLRSAWPSTTSPPEDTMVQGHHTHMSRLDNRGVSLTSGSSHEEQGDGEETWFGH